MNNRQAFIEALTELAEKDPRIILVVCDVGFSYIEDFAAKFPKQFLNAGVTEQAATGICAGLALAGMKPYLYTMINFVCMRNYEQLRNDICYHNADVKLIGVQGSVHYKFLGFSHNLQNGENEEDLLRNLPNLERHYPETPEATRQLITESYSRTNPCYVRI